MLVELNAERAAEEKRGVIHWLRPEYQAGAQSTLNLKPSKATKPAKKTKAAPALRKSKTKTPWPSHGPGSRYWTRPVHDDSALLRRNDGEVNPERLAVIGAFLDIVLGGFPSIEEFSLPFAVRAVWIVDAVSGLAVMDDLGYFHTFLWLGAFWCPEKGEKRAGRVRSEPKQRTWGNAYKQGRLCAKPWLGRGGGGAHDRT